MRMAVCQAIFMRMFVGVLGRRRELGHFGLRVHMGMRQPVIMIAPVNVGVIMRSVRLSMMCCRAAVAITVTAYWHVHFQSCMFQVTG